jgi:hypothetical protein
MTLPRYYGLSVSTGTNCPMTHVACGYPWNKIYSFVRSQETHRNRHTSTLVWKEPRHQCDCSFSYVTEYDGRDRVWNFNVSALGSDSVLYYLTKKSKPRREYRLWIPNQTTNNPSQHLTVDTGQCCSLSLSEALLLFYEEVKTPHNKGNTEIRIKRLTLTKQTRGFQNN